MKNKFYLHEFKLFDGEEYITFNIVALNESKKEILVAVTNRGKISHVTYDLFEDKNGLKVAFSSDTCVCENLHTMLKDADYAFVDLASVSKHPRHISIDEFVELTKQYNNVKIFPVHTNDECQEFVEKNNLNPLHDGQVLEF